MDKEHFDNWADTYNNSIQNFHERYPFGGYNLIEEIINKIYIQRGITLILDIGIGTGKISSVVYNKGAILYGVDFSKNMLEKCKAYLPEANLINCDISNGLKNIVFKSNFNYVISTYVFHHFDNKVKIDIIKQALDILDNKGSIIISDIIFDNLDNHDSFRENNKNIFDTSEDYIIAEEFNKLLSKNNIIYKYKQLNIYTGTYIIYK
jgi:putative AdoMet-dependent methyltransferase